MCETHEHNHLNVYARATQYDPTRTLTLRNAFAREMRRRFDELARAVKKSIVDEDVFGFNQNLITQIQTPGRQAFAFPRSSNKIEAFMKWMRTQVEANILNVEGFQQVGTGINQAWTNRYITDGYRRGIQRARYEMVKAGFDVPPLSETGGIQAAMQVPLHVDRLGVLYTRTFSDLRGITTSMDTQISRILAQGMAEGTNPTVLARQMVKTITGRGNLSLTDTLGRFIPAKRRAEMLARTEIIRAHHLGTIQEYRNWEIEGVTVIAEFSTAGDDRVCSVCAGMHGNRYDLKQVEYMIPVHPYCRCIAIPVNPNNARQVLPQPVNDPVAADRVASRFIKREHGERYLQSKEEFAKKLDELPDPLKEVLKTEKLKFDDREYSDFANKFLSLIREKDSDFIKYLDDMGKQWQASTHRDYPMAFKMRANELEKGLNKVHIPSNLTEDHFNNPFFKEALEGLTDDIYIKLRAMSQAWDEFILGALDKSDDLLLYRGTDGIEGKKIRNMILKEGMKRQNFLIEDSALSGYADRAAGAAENFGMNADGITIRTTINTTDVVVSKDLLSGLTSRYWGEKEYIVRGIKKDINIRDIRIRIETPNGRLYKEFDETFDQFLKRAAEEFEVPLNKIQAKIATFMNI
jgi:SPP1 gp7 family putative phage head morphogenesis protein